MMSSEDGEHEFPSVEHSPLNEGPWGKCISSELRLLAIIDRRHRPDVIETLNNL